MHKSAGFCVLFVFLLSFAHAETWIRGPNGERYPTLRSDTEFTSTSTGTGDSNTNEGEETTDEVPTEPVPEPEPLDIPTADCETLQKKLTVESGTAFVVNLLKTRGNHKDMMRVFQCLVPTFNYGSGFWEKKLMPGHKCELYQDIVNRVAQEIVHFPADFLHHGLELFHDRFRIADQEIDVDDRQEMQGLWDACNPGKPYSELGQTDLPLESEKVEIKVSLNRDCIGHFHSLRLGPFAYTGALVYPYGADKLYTDWGNPYFSTMITAAPAKKAPAEGMCIKIIDTGYMQFDGISCMVSAYYKKLGKEKWALVVDHSVISKCPFVIGIAPDSTAENPHVEVTWRGFPYNPNVVEGPGNR